MALVYKDRVKQVCSAPTTTNPFDFTGAATSTGYQTFVAALADGETCVYAAEDADGDWEVGIGTWTEASDQLARTTILASSNSGSAETFSGDTTVYITADATTLTNQVNRPVLVVTGTGASAQTFTANTFTKATTALNATPVLDTISGWDGTNKKYVPNLAGKYFVTAQVKFSSTADTRFVLCGIYKNGTLANQSARLFNGSGGSTDAETGLAIGIIQMNGSTDYIELYGYPQTNNEDSVADSGTFIQAFYLGK